MKRLLLTLAVILLIGTLLPAQLNVSQPSPVNVSQINGVTPLMGAGNTGTGSPRVTVATDNAAIPTWGHGATGSAVPANAVYEGERGSSGLAGHIGCDNQAVYDASTSGSTQLVALTSGQTIYVCGFVIFSAGTVNVNLRYGTGTACATGPTNITPAFQLTAQTGASYGNGEGVVTKTIASNALCINTSAAVAVQALVTYAKF